MATSFLAKEGERVKGTTRGCHQAPEGKKVGAEGRGAEGEVVASAVAAVLQGKGLQSRVS